MPTTARALRMAAAYVALTFALTWSCWGTARLALAACASPELAGALQVLGTLMPSVSVYALYPRLACCGLAPATPDSADPRAGFWRLAFLPGRGVRGWALFAALLVWRWAMFRAAFGFPATPADALSNAWACLPGLFLGGGFEEVGWRGCLQPCLEAALAGRGPGPRRQTGAALAAPLIVGLVWAAWHAPLFFMPGAYQQGMAALPFVGVAVALSYTLAALRRATGGVLACVLAHAWYNAMLVDPMQPGAVATALFAAETLAGASVLVVEARRGREALAPRG